MKPIAITMGEPAGIGGEIVIKAWHKRAGHKLPPFFLIDNLDRLKKIDPSLLVKEINTPEEADDVFDKALPVLPMDLPVEPVLGELNAQNGAAVLQSIERAASLALSGDVSAIVTSPIHKAALYDIGFDFPGHTEFLGNLCGKDSKAVMMLACDELKVVPLTIHVPLKDVAALITPDHIIETSEIILNALQIDFGLEKPRLAVAGLNPHAGEDGTMGSEEKDIIIPALEILREKGHQISGPLSADTLFHAEARENYDTALCMYHDQALIPIKTLDFHRGVNVTLGLPIVRTSPDHGTALNIAGRDMANPSSLIESIKMAERIAQNREG